MQFFDLGLQELPFFADLQPAEVEVFIKNTGAVVKRYSKGSRVLKAYEPNAQIGILAEGEALVLAEDRFGNESVSHELMRGSIFGGTSAILPRFTNHTSVEALTDVLVLWVPYRSLLVSGPKLGKIHGIVMKNLLEAFCLKGVYMMQKIELLSQKILRERLILYLLQRGKRQGEAHVRVPGRVQLAKELECNRSALTREVNQMKAEGLLECGAGWMRLLKKDVE